MGNTNPITALQDMTDIQNLQHKDKGSGPITFVLAKRSSHPTPTQRKQDWATFDQMRIVPHHIMDTYAIPHPKTNSVPQQQSPSCPLLPSVPTQSPKEIPVILQLGQNPSQSPTGISNKNTGEGISTAQNSVDMPPQVPTVFQTLEGYDADIPTSQSQVPSGDTQLQKDIQGPPLRRSSRMLTKRDILTYPIARMQSGRYIHAAQVLLGKEKHLVVNKDKSPFVKHLHHPQHCKLFHVPVKPDVPPHIGAA